jgi:hypothetical protein
MPDRRRARVATPFDESHAEIPEGMHPLSFKCRRPGFPSRKAGFYGQKMGSTK